MPAAVAALVPVAAIWFSWKQFERSTRLSSDQFTLNAELTRQQARETSDVARRQVEIANRQAEIAERKLLHETYEVRFQAWKAVDEISRKLYRIIMNRSTDSRVHFGEFFEEFNRFSEAELHARMLFPNEVGEAITELEQAILGLNVMSAALNSTAVADVRRDEAQAGGFQNADQRYVWAMQGFRHSVRREIVFGIGDEPFPKV